MAKDTRKVVVGVIFLFFLLYFTIKLLQRKDTDYVYSLPISIHLPKASSSFYLLTSGTSGGIPLFGMNYFPPNPRDTIIEEEIQLFGPPTVKRVKKIDSIKFTIIGKKALFSHTVDPSDTGFYFMEIKPQPSKKYIIRISQEKTLKKFAPQSYYAKIYIKDDQGFPISTSFHSFMCTSPLNYFYSFGETTPTGTVNVSFTPYFPWDTISTIHWLKIAPHGRKLGGEHHNLKDVPKIKPISVSVDSAPKFGLTVESDVICRTHIIGDKDSSFMFSFAIISDIHIGDMYDDYGTTGFEDSIKYLCQGMSAYRLKKVVESINSLIRSESILFVVALGDITESGERSEFLTAKTILSTLNIPFIPVFGNHDGWPYYYNDVGDFVEKQPKDSSKIGEEFGKIFDSVYTYILPSHFPTWSIFPMDSVYYFNFSLTIEDVCLLFTDWIERSFAPPLFPGIVGYASLNKGKTWEWFWEKYDSSSSIINITHHPLRGMFLTDFSFFELEEFEQEIDKRGGITHLKRWMAGHLHRNKKYTIKPGSTIIGKCKESGPCYAGWWTLVKVYKEKGKISPFPCGCIMCR